MDYNRSERLPWIIVILIVAFVCFVSWFGAFLMHRGDEDKQFGSYKSFTGAQGLEVQVAGDGFVYYDGSSLTYKDSAGDVLWNYLIGSGADFYASTGGVAAWNGRTLTIIDIENGTTSYSGDQGVEVVSARVGSKYAAVHLDEEGDSRISVIEKGGRSVYTAELDQLTCVDYGFFSGGAQLWIMALDTTGSVPTCEITTYSPRSMSIVGSISDMEQLMYSVNFRTDSVCCTGVTHYKAYDYNGREIESRRRLVYGWYLLDTGKGADPLMAFVPTGQTDGVDAIKDVRLMTGGQERILHMPFPCSFVKVLGDRVYGFSSDGHVLVGSIASQKVDAYQMPFYIDRVYGITESGVAIIASGNTLHMLSLGNLE